MDERILEQLENVPSEYDDHFGGLCHLTSSYADLEGITKTERERLNYELNLIKKWGIAKVFLFGYDLCFNNGFGTTCGVESNSYVNYLLGISTVNPVLYNLPFERFFNEYRRFLPSYNVVVRRGGKGKILKKIYDKYGKNSVIKSKEDNDNYFALSKSINSELIREKRIVAKLNEQSYQENVSMLSYIDLSKLGLYNFSINEVREIEYSAEIKFSEKQIYEQAKLYFAYQIPQVPAFTEIEQVNEILTATENKLIYQEQLLEILNKLCDFDLSKADFIRREIAKGKKESLKDVQEILSKKYGNSGQELLDYLYKQGKYTVSKGYVIATLHNLIEYGE